MCGRFTKNYTWEQARDYMELIPSRAPSNFPPNFNVCPTDPIDVVIETKRGRELISMRWGLIPGWWKKSLKEANFATFNARAETVTEKPFFRNAFKQTRCLIPATGYYEWRDTPGGKQPYYFTRVDGNIITFAGLWDEWKNPDTGDILKSCTMIIAEPNKFVAEVHDRMPVILEKSQWRKWLTNKADIEILKPAAEDILLKRPVSKRVNSSRADGEDATLIEAVPI